MAQQKAKTTGVNKSGEASVKANRGVKSACGSKNCSNRACSGDKKSSTQGCKTEDCGCSDGSRQPKGEEVGLTQGEFYKRLYKQAAMGEDSLKAVKELAEERSLKSFLTGQLKAYESFRKNVEPKIAASGDRPDGAPIVSKLMVKGGVMMNTIVDKSSSKLAEIVIQGANMGVIAVTRLLNEAEQIGLQTQLGEEIMCLYDKQIEVLKTYL